MQQRMWAQMSLEQDTILLQRIVEVDETCIGGKPHKP